MSDQLLALIKRYQPRVVALDMSRVPDLEYSALQVLMEADQRAAVLGVEWWLAGLNPKVLDGGPQVGSRGATRSRTHAVQCTRRDRTLPASKHRRAAQ